MSADQFQALWTAIVASPFVFCVAVILIAGVTWRLAGQRFSDRLESLEHRIKLRDDEVARLEKAAPIGREEIYADKLNLSQRSLDGLNEISPPQFESLSESQKVGKTFIPSERSLFDLMKYYDDRTTIESQSLIEPYIGKWVIVKARVADVRQGRSWITVTLDTDSMSEKPDQELAIITLYFNSYDDIISMLRKGDEIQAIGRIERVTGHDITLEDAELFSDNMT